MADEINRASPRTQSALLQAMQEHRVSVAGQYHAAAAPFHVLATQNPLEQEGTYPLPEAQLDRFLMQIDVVYPDRDGRAPDADRHHRRREAAPEQVLTAEELIAAQRLVRRIPVGESVVEAILDLVPPAGPTPRSAEARQAHRLGTGSARQPGADAGLPRPRADGRAVLARRSTTCWRSPAPVLRHRMALTFAARADGVTIDQVIERLCAPLA